MPEPDLARIPQAPVTRFAPSPTGYLHLGHVANALWTFGVAARKDGRVILRIENHDRGRCRPGFERAILEDLDWLGLTPDPESRASLRTPGSRFRQSDSDPAYGEALGRLEAFPGIYGCGCSRAEIARRLAADGLESWDELRYPGTCRHLGRQPDEGLGIRVRLVERDIAFHDAMLGPAVQRPAAQCGDLLLRDAPGNWTYQFAVTVDDLRHGITLVVRGEDLLPSTGRQIQLAGMLGRAEPPVFLHHPLIVDGAGNKLSKRDGAAGIRDMREAGWSAERVLGEAAWRTGLLPRPGSLAAEDLGGLFR